MSSSFYDFQRSLLPCVMAMSQRGLCVDDALRKQRLAALTQEAESIREQVKPIVESVKDRLKEKELLWTTKVCRSCRNGKKKRLTCAACSSMGKHTEFSFNLGSQRQMCDVLYNGLKLPIRTRDGHLCADEEAFKSLLALDRTTFVGMSLRFSKLSSIREIYDRLAPALDGCVRTVFNIAGTYTGRFSSAAAFYVPHSTNLQNLPAQEAQRDPLFAVRECIVPLPGEVFVYADLSQAEARVVAVLSDDGELLERWVDAGFDLHRWTASRIFDKSMDAITDAERFLGKKSRHALNYGMGPNKFWRTVNDSADLTGVAITLAQAKEIYKGYHALHPNLDKVWWNRVQRMLESRQPMTATHCGWQANLWPRFDEAGQLDQESLRAAIAWEPQHTVVHVLNEGMQELYSKEEGYRVLFQGHDSVLLGASKHRWREVARKAKKALERSIVVHGTKMTIPAEVFVGKENWASLERVL